MRIGAHMWISRGLAAAARKGAEIGCETIQLFAGSPGSWHSRRIDPEEARDFRRLVEEFDLRPVTVHTQYLLNLASPDPAIHARSTAALGDAMRCAHALGAQYVVTHVGSHRGSGKEQGIEQVREAVSTTLGQLPGKVVLLLENSSGAGDSVGSNFEELHMILDRLGEYGDRLGVCLDTAHLWGAGYDISGPKAVAQTVEGFDSVVGSARLKLVHLNDTRVGLGSRSDRHANIGSGNIGERGFAALLHHPALISLAGIIETPATTIEDDVRNIRLLKRLRGTGKP